MAIDLKQFLVSTKHSSPPRVLIHGAEKIGKSTFASQSPSPVFLPVEKGLSGVDAQALVYPGKDRLESFEEFNEMLKLVESGEHTFKSLVIDSADWLEALIHQKICKGHGVELISKAADGFGNGYIEALNLWRNLLLRLDRLNSKGMTIIFVCHSKAVTFNDPLHEPYDIWQMKLHTPKSGGGSMDLLKEWADVIGFAEAKKFVTKTKSDETKFKAKESGARILHLEGSAGFIAGNRYGLPKQCELNWPSFMAGFSQPETSQPNKQKEAA